MCDKQKDSNIGCDIVYLRDLPSAVMTLYIAISHKDLKSVLQGWKAATRMFEAFCNLYHAWTNTKITEDTDNTMCAMIGCIIVVGVSLGVFLSASM